MRDSIGGRGPGRLARALGVVLLGLSGWGHGAAWAEDFRAALGANEVVVPFPEGTVKQHDDPATHTSVYEFIVADRDTAKTKLVVQWVISAYADDVPKDDAAALGVIRALVLQSGLSIPEKRIQALAVPGMNEQFDVYWAPYYHLGTDNPQAPFLIHKSTVLVAKNGSLAVAMSMIGSLPFKEATPKDLKTAEGFMDTLLVDMVHHVSLGPHEDAAAAP